MKQYTGRSVGGEDHQKESKMAEAYIVDAVRTPIGKRNGCLSMVRPDELAGDLIKARVDALGIDPREIDDVVFGCVTQAGDQGGNIARMAVLASGLPVCVSATTVDRQCGSSATALHIAATGIMSGLQELVIAGGVESMSRVPMGSDKLKLGDRVLDRFDMVSQGPSAELVAEKWRLDRHEMAELCYESHRRAVGARGKGGFAREIVPVTTVIDGRTTLVEHDEGPRPDTSVEKIESLKPVFKEGGCITAGNASQISDGATCVLTTDEATAYGIFRGEVDGTQAHIAGKLRISNVGDIMKLTSAYDPNTAREAQAATGDIAEHVEDLTSRGANRASVGATFRGTARLATTEDAESLGFTFIEPIFRQASSAIAAPEIAEKTSLARQRIEFVAPLRQNDLTYPVMKIAAIRSDDTGDTVELEAVLRSEGEIVQRHVLLYRLGAPSAAETPDSANSPDFRQPLELCEGAETPAAARIVVAIVNAITGQYLAGDTARAWDIECTFVEQARPTQLELQCWKPGRGQTIRFELHDLEQARRVLLGTLSA